MLPRHKGTKKFIQVVPSLRGLRTRAIPAGVNGPPLLTFFERERELDSTDPKLHVSEGNTRRLLRESEDDETPQRAFFASEEAHREPAESVVYFRSSTSQFTQLVGLKATTLFDGTGNSSLKTYEKSLL